MPCRPLHSTYYTAIYTTQQLGWFWRPTVHFAGQHLGAASAGQSSPAIRPLMQEGDEEEGGEGHGGGKGKIKKEREGQLYSKPVLSTPHRLSNADDNNSATPIRPTLHPHTLIHLLTLSAAAPAAASTRKSGGGRIMEKEKKTSEKSEKSEKKGRKEKIECEGRKR